MKKNLKILGTIVLETSIYTLIQVFWAQIWIKSGTGERCNRLRTPWHKAGIADELEWIF